MNSETVKLSGRDLLWYEAEAPVAAAKSGSWKRHLLVVLALVALKLVALASSDGVELVTTWINDTRPLLGWP
ncbi:hypothetical protein ABS71_02645 [bacterium SCN 62-11]|nr:hypothetical protein [Candidatus Eremiobacteraeota bacterium]ODT77281.1 MAG: hypothetical protein ABS71_02645 [bacterium SCN 62-11]